MKIALADAVAVVRDELLEAAARGAGSDLAFAVAEVHLEFSVELHRDSEAKGGFKAWIISAEAGTSAGQSDGHRVAVTLSPRPADGKGELLVSGDEARPHGPGDVSGHLGR